MSQRTTIENLIATSMTLQQVATELGVHINSVRDAAAANKLKTFRSGFGSKPKLYVALGDFDNFKASGAAPKPRQRKAKIAITTVADPVSA